MANAVCVNDGAGKPKPDTTPIGTTEKTIIALFENDVGAEWKH